MIVEKQSTSVLVAAKKVDDAIKEGLAELGVTLDAVKVDVVESGGLFRKAKVRLTLESDAASEPAPEKTEKSDKHDKAEKTDKPEKVEKAEKVEKSEKTDKHDKAEKADKHDKPEKAEQAAESAEPAKAESAKPAEPPVSDSKQSAPVKDKHARSAPAGKSDAGKAVPVRPKSQAQPPAAPKKEERPRDPAEEKAAADKALAFVRELVGKMGFDAQVVQTAPGQIAIDAPEGDDSLIIGRHGETLAAISYLAETGARADKCRLSVTVDCNGYRGRRAASLAAMARRRADEAVNKGRKIKLEPMERIDRRTIHNALTGDDRVSTASEGKEPYRCVVIIPKDERRGASRNRRGGKGRYRHDSVEDLPVPEEPAQD